MDSVLLVGWDGCHVLRGAIREDIMMLADVLCSLCRTAPQAVIRSPDATDENEFRTVLEEYARMVRDHDDDGNGGGVHHGLIYVSAFATNTSGFVCDRHNGTGGVPLTYLDTILDVLERQSAASVSVLLDLYAPTLRLSLFDLENEIEARRSRSVVCRENVSLIISVTCERLCSGETVGAAFARALAHSVGDSSGRSVDVNDVFTNVVHSLNQRVSHVDRPQSLVVQTPDYSNAVYPLSRPHDTVFSVRANVTLSSATTAHMLGHVLSEADAALSSVLRERGTRVSVGSFIVTLSGLDESTKHGLSRLASWVSADGPQTTFGCGSIDALVKLNTYLAAHASGTTATYAAEATTTPMSFVEYTELVTTCRTMKKTRTTIGGTRELDFSVIALESIAEPSDDELEASVSTAAPKSLGRATPAAQNRFAFDYAGIDVRILEASATIIVRAWRRYRFVQAVEGVMRREKAHPEERKVRRVFFTAMGIPDCAPRVVSLHPRWVWLAEHPRHQETRAIVKEHSSVLGLVQVARSTVSTGAVVLWLLVLALCILHGVLIGLVPAWWIGPAVYVSSTASWDREDALRVAAIVSVLHVVLWTLHGSFLHALMQRTSCCGGSVVERMARRFPKQVSYQVLASVEGSERKVLHFLFRSLGTAVFWCLVWLTVWFSMLSNGDAAVSLIGLFYVVMDVVLDTILAAAATSNPSGRSPNHLLTRVLSAATSTAVSGIYAVACVHAVAAENSVGASAPSDAIRSLACAAVLFVSYRMAVHHFASGRGDSFIPAARMCYLHAQCREFLVDDAEPPHRRGHQRSSKTSKRSSRNQCVGMFGLACAFFLFVIVLIIVFVQNAPGSHEVGCRAVFRNGTTVSHSFAMSDSLWRDAPTADSWLQQCRREFFPLEGAVLLEARLLLDTKYGAPDSSTPIRQCYP
eukprot:PhM_4_TR4515/c0_g1_i1/m.58685